MACDTPIYSKEIATGPQPNSHEEYVTLEPANASNTNPCGTSQLAGRRIYLNVN